eukprot:111607_1
MRSVPNNNEEQCILTYNISLIGLYAAGKTSIVNKLRQNRFVKSYKPTEDRKILKHTLKQTVKTLEDTTVKIAFKDSQGISCIHSNDDSFLQRKAHILCFVYDHDNIDSYECIKYVLENNDVLYSTNRVIMVIRNKVDNKTMISDTQPQCEQQFKEITSINNEIMFVKNFSAKSKSSDKIEKMFVKAIELYRQYYGNMPPPGKKKRSKSDAYVGDKISLSELNRDEDTKIARKKKKRSKSDASGMRKTRRKTSTHEGGKRKKYERTNNMTPTEGNAETNGAQCACVIL